MSLWDLVSSATNPLNVKHAVHEATGSCMTCAFLSLKQHCKNLYFVCFTCSYNLACAVTNFVHLFMHR